MANEKQHDDKPKSHVTYDGRTIVDVEKLLEDAQVKETLATVARIRKLTQIQTPRPHLRIPKSQLG